MKEGYFTRFSGCRMSRTLEVHDLLGVGVEEKCV
jgi:hypothetical protein